MNRSTAARVAALTRWSQEPDRRAATNSARTAAFARFERQVDPEGTLSPEERYRRAKLAQRAHMIRLRDRQVKR